MLHQAIWWYPSFSQALRQYQAWHGLLVSKIQELQEICCRTIGDMGKNIGGIGRFYTNYRKHRRSCQACSTHPLVTFLSRKSFFLSEVKVFRSSKFTFCFLKKLEVSDEYIEAVYIWNHAFRCFEPRGEIQRIWSELMGEQ